jgi:uncharacterized protein
VRAADVVTRLLLAAMGVTVPGAPACQEAEPPRRVATLEAVLTDRCDHEDGEACSLLAEAAARGRSRPHDRAEAMRLYRRACRYHHPASCRIVAELLLEAGELPGESAAPADLLRQACDGGDPTGCRRLAERVAAAAASSPPEAERAAALLARAVQLMRGRCARAIYDACHELAELYRTGEGVAADEATAARMERAACTGEVAAACVAVGRADLAAQLLERACRSGDHLGCVQRSSMHPDEPMDEDRLGYAVRACRAGFAASCRAAAVALESGGAGVAADPGGAQDLYARAAAAWERECGAGYADSCRSLGELRRAGKIAPQPR